MLNFHIIWLMILVLWIQDIKIKLKVEKIQVLGMNVEKSWIQNPTSFISCTMSKMGLFHKGFVGAQKWTSIFERVCLKHSHTNVIDFIKLLFSVWYWDTSWVYLWVIWMLLAPRNRQRRFERSVWDRWQFCMYVCMDGCMYVCAQRTNQLLGGVA